VGRGAQTKAACPLYDFTDEKIPPAKKPPKKSSEKKTPIGDPPTKKGPKRVAHR
jgi:hypothetical protein